MKELNVREKRWFSIVLSSFGIFLIISGLIMNTKIKPLIQTKLDIQIEKRQISETQAKSNEIKVKDLEIEINHPISIDIKDYLEEIENLDETTLRSLKLDTSLVNINEAGTYEYKILYKKKAYIGKIKVKEKELPNVSFTLKTIKIQTKDSLSENPRSYIKETVSDEVFNNITLDLSKVDTSKQGDYTYYITYKGVTYQGTIEVRDPAPTVIIKEKEEEITCPEDSTKQENTCICNDVTKTFDTETKTCK